MSPLEAYRQAQTPAPAPAPEAVPDDELIGAQLAVAGPQTPAGGPATTHAPQLPRVFAAAGPRIQVTGLHGGAGASTLTRLLGAESATDRGLRVPFGGDHVVLLVARTHADGLEQVRRAARSFAGHQLDDVRLLGLVLVDDGPRMSKAQQQAVRAVLRVLPMTWRLGWHEPWRVRTDLPPDELPARIRRTGKAIRDRGMPLTTPTQGTTKETR